MEKRYEDRENLKIECGCGGYTEMHSVGDQKCFREICWDRPREVAGGKWKIPGETSPITEFSLLQQRMYRYCDENDAWTRVKAGYSTNSLTGDW